MRIHSFDDSIINAFEKKEFVVDCPNMEIIQCCVNNPIAWNGSGFIFQECHQDGVRVLIKIKMLVRQVPHSQRMDYFKSSANLKSGQTYPDDKYFIVKARSVDGYEWESSRFLPNFFDGQDCLLIEGYVNEVYRFFDLDVGYESNSFMSMYFIDNNKLRFPCNVDVEIEKKISGKIYSRKLALDIAEFHVSDFKFKVQRYNDFINVSVYSNGKSFKRFFEIRVLEALSFVFSQELLPSIISSTENSISHKLRVFASLKSSKKSSFKYKPIPDNLYEDYKNERGSFWELFHKYMLYVVSHESGRWCDLTSYVISIIRASEASLDAQALSLAIAVEGVLKLEPFSHFGNPSDLTLKELCKLHKLITSSDIDDNFKKRVKGLIGSIKSSRPKDKLIDLVRLELLRDDLANTWSKLRNSQAHANIQSKENIDKLFCDCGKVRTLFNELVFLVIGYNGYYTDYSEIGYPIKMAEKSLPRDC
jgi:hypothetical protein